MRDFATTMLSSTQDCVHMAKKSKYWSKSAQKDAEALMTKLDDEVAALKKALIKNCTVDDLKSLVLQTAGVVKECQTACKEYKVVMNKTGSVASKNSKK